MKKSLTIAAVLLTLGVTGSASALVVVDRGSCGFTTHRVIYTRPVVATHVVYTRPVVSRVVYVSPYRTFYRPTFYRPSFYSGYWGPRYYNTGFYGPRWGSRVVVSHPSCF